MLPAEDILATPMEQALHIEGHRLIIYLQDADYAALKRKAADRQRSAVELSGELLDDDG